PGFPMRRVWAVTNDTVDTTAKGKDVFKNEINLVLPSPRKVPIQVVFADTRQPAPKVFVEASGSSASTDDSGRAELTLPDGRYRVHMLQRIGTPYLRSEDDLAVSESSVRQPTKLELKSAAVAEITVVDAETGGPLAGVDIWRQEPSADALNSRRAV